MVFGYDTHANVFDLMRIATEEEIYHKCFKISIDTISLRYIKAANTRVKGANLAKVSESKNSLRGAAITKVNI